MMTSTRREKCERMLMLNNSISLKDMRDIANKILLNCINNPNDPKYSRLRVSNQTLNQRVLSRSGGPELLVASGFECEEIEGEKYMVMRETSRRFIESSIAWLNDAIEKSIQLGINRGADDTDICAEVEVQIRLPTGVSVRGGFMAFNSIGQVLRFAATFFRYDKVANVVLRMPHCATSMTHEDWVDVTLAEVDCGSRILFLASTTSDDALGEAMEESAKRVIAEKQAQRELVKEERKVKVDAAEERQQEREKLLQQFKADRDAMKRRLRK